nr:tRNA (N6-isopentenyl adenosine(37)-C2)-methylthiotransferase MiaB [Bacilli bacterium]
MKTNVINTPDLKKAQVRKKEATFFMSGATQHTKEELDLLNNKRYYIHTYGCQANVRDEETMRGLLENIGMTRVEEASEADVIIINTCAVRENAEDKVYGEIGNLKRLRKINKDLVLAICGCMV